MSEHCFWKCSDSNRTEQQMPTNPTVQPPRRRAPGEPDEGAVVAVGRDDLRTRLERGEFTDSFPGEHELRAQYGVSRHTVREALRELRDSIERLGLASGRPVERRTTLIRGNRFSAVAQGAPAPATASTHPHGSHWSMREPA
jgi:hypothetical protein